MHFLHSLQKFRPSNGVAMQRAIKTILLCSALGGCAFIPTANLHKSRPLNLSLDVAPGYGQPIYLPIFDDSLELLVQRVKSSPSKKWGPTFFLSYYSEQADTSYYLYLFVDASKKSIYAQTRFVDMKTQNNLSEKIYPQRYDLDHKFKVKAVLDGKTVSFYLDGKLVGTQEISHEPKFVELGGSSGTFNISLVSPPLPPAPE
jgi:hypothetical protein